RAAGRPTLLQGHPAQPARLERPAHDGRRRTTTGPVPRTLLALYGVAPAGSPAPLPATGPRPGPAERHSAITGRPRPPTPPRRQPRRSLPPQLHANCLRSPLPACGLLHGARRGSFREYGGGERPGVDRRPGGGGDGGVFAGLVGFVGGS